MRIKETLVGAVVASAGGLTTIFSTTVGPVLGIVGVVLAVWYGLSEEPAK